MPFIKMKLHKLVLDSGNFTKKLDEAIKAQIRQAARAFFRIASESVPVRTGFARGSLGSILEALGGGSTLSATQSITKRKTPAQSFYAATLILAKQKFLSSGIFSGKRPALKNVQLPTEYYYFGRRKVAKTPEAGKQFATKPENIFQVKGQAYLFNFAVSITYFDINDQYQNPRTPSSPWQAFERGRLFFQQYMRTVGVKKLPKVTDYILKEEIG
jgi:hypothetical protein